MNAKIHLFSMRAVMMLLVVLCSLEAWADKSGNCGANGDNVTYTYVESTHTLTISHDSAEQEGIYDLQGRKVNQPSRGLYIMNGKKMWVQ